MPNNFFTSLKLKLRSLSLKQPLFWILVFSFPFLLAIHTWDSPDTFMHLNRGKLIWETGHLIPTTSMILQHPGAVFYWLFQVCLWGLFQATGIPGVTIFFALLWLGVWGILLGAYYKISSEVGLGFWLVTAATACCHRIIVRPEVISYLLISLYLFLISRWNEQGPALSPTEIIKKSALIILIQALWAGCHGYFFLGSLLFLFAAIGKATAHQKEGAKPFFYFSALSLCASALSPFGFLTWKTVFTHVFLLKGLSSVISEFASPMDWNLISQIWVLKIYVALWAGTFALVLWKVATQKEFSFEVLTAGLGLYLGASSSRFMPLLILFSFPLFATETSPLLKKRPIPPVARIFLIVLVLIGDFFIVNNGFYRSFLARQRFGFGLSPMSYSTEINPYFQRHPFHGLLFNVPETGGYLAYYNPKLNLYGDTMFTQVEETGEYVFASGIAGFKALDEKYRFDAVLVQLIPSFELVNYLLDSNEWQFVFGDLYHILLSRNKSPFASELPRETPSYPKDGDRIDDFTVAYPMMIWQQFWSKRGTVP